jgi:hypothetical protein
MNRKKYFKVLRTEGVGVLPNCDYIKYVRKSRLDDFPIFSIEYPDGDNPLYFIVSNLIVNTKPGYTLKSSEIEYIPLPEDYLSFDGISSIANDLVPVKPMDAPNGTLFYIDVVYDNPDERLLLML